MNSQRAYNLLKEIGFVRRSGTSEELKAEKIIQAQLEQLGVDSQIEEFEVQLPLLHKVQLEADGKEYEVTAYECCESTPKEGLVAPFYYMETTSEVDKVNAKGKIVLVNGYLNHATYKALVEAQVLAFITFSGDVIRDNKRNSDLDVRELRAQLHQEFGKLPGVHLRTADAQKLVKQKPKMLKLVIDQETCTNKSRNLISEIKGSQYPNEVITFTAHIDTVPFSKGVYDNGAGSVIILEMLRYFLQNKPARTVRFIWCGSEERGLLGSKAYVKDHKDELEKIVLVINVDVGGVVLGKELAIVTADQSLAHYVDYLAKENGIALTVRQDIYSSDCIPFVDQGIPAINFARFGEGNAAHIHSRMDCLDFISAAALGSTGCMVELFANKMANAVAFPVPRTIPDNIIEKTNNYLNKQKK